MVCLPLCHVMFVLMLFRNRLVEVLRAMLSMHRHPPENVENDHEEDKGGDIPEDKEGTQDGIEPNPRVLTPDQVCWMMTRH